MKTEPIVFTWAGGELSLGYLGCFRWFPRTNWRDLPPLAALAPAC